MLTYNQDLKQLYMIMRHHIYKFPSLLLARLFVRMLPTAQEYYLHHPTWIVQTFCNWQSSWLLLDERLATKYFYSLEIPTATPKFGYIMFKDVPNVFQLSSSQHISWPLSIFGPRDGHRISSTSHLRMKFRRQGWLEYECGKLLRPYDPKLRSLIHRLSTEPPRWGRRDLEKEYYNIILPTLIQAIDYVGVGIKDDWPTHRTTAQPNFYTWYEPLRTVPAISIEAMKQDFEIMLRLPNMCGNCWDYVNRCNCDMEREEPEEEPGGYEDPR